MPTSYDIVTDEIMHIIMFSFTIFIYFADIQTKSFYMIVIKLSIPITALKRDM